jgi:hypothetical protein
MNRFRSVAILALLVVSFAGLSSCLSSSTSTASAPKITTMTIPSTAIIGAAYAGATINTSNGTLPLSYSIVSGALPLGLVLGTSNNQGTISGTPQRQSTGPYPFTVQVKDSDNPARTSTQSYTITLSNPTLPAVTCPTGNASPCVLPAGTVGVSYNATFTATGTGPFTWGSTGVPLGLGLNPSTGVLSGIPSQSGTNLAFTVFVTDVVGQISPTLASTITIAPASQLKITSALTLPPGVVGTPYNVQLQASGGFPPYAWIGVSGSVPNGVTLSPGGVISGTPSQTQSTPFTFQVQVTDAESPAMMVTSGQFSMTVTSNITVTITNKFAAIDAGAAAVTVNANVSNDTVGDGGVSWTLQSGSPLADCSGTGAGKCGTISAIGNPSTSATYTPPATQPSGANDTPTITATAADDTSKSDSFQFTINPVGAAECPVGRESAMSGSFAYLMKGFDANGAVAIAGSVHTDGTGKITSGVEDINRAGTGPQTNLSIDPSSSSYTLGPDARGCMTVATAAGLQTFRFSLAAFTNGGPTTGNIIEFDDSTGEGTRGSGIIRAQDASSFSNDKFASSYAFGLSGFGAAAQHVALAGTLMSDGKGNIASGNFDRNDAGNLTTDSSKLSGTYSIPAGSTTGRGAFNATLNGTPFTFAAYMVNSGEVILAGIDQISATNQITSGEAIASAGPFGNATLAGRHILRETAMSHSGSAPGTRATIGALTFDGKTAGGVTGTLFNDESGVASATNILRGAATYSVDQRTGRIIFTGLGTDSPVGYVARTGSGITAFLVGSDGGAADGALEFQSSGAANFNTSTFAGSFSFGTDENVDYSTTNASHSGSFDSSAATVSGHSDQSQPRANGLYANQPFSNAFTFNAEGVGTAGTNPAVTNGTRIFFIDEQTAGTHPAITIAEKQ